ncbi:YchJ family protein [Stappia albiluteola]
MELTDTIMAACPCGSRKTTGECCGPFLARDALPETAEQLMRSRYSAYVAQDIDYLEATLWPALQRHFDRAATAAWSAENHWIGLTVLETREGGARDSRGTVRFIARYLAGGELREHREHSLFRRKAGRWYYVEALKD